MHSFPTTASSRRTIWTESGCSASYRLPDGQSAALVDCTRMVPYCSIPLLFVYLYHFMLRSPPCQSITNPLLHHIINCSSLSSLVYGSDEYNRFSAYGDGWSGVDEVPSRQDKTRQQCIVDLDAEQNLN